MENHSARMHIHAVPHEVALDSQAGTKLLISRTNFSESAMNSVRKAKGPFKSTRNPRVWFQENDYL